MRFVLRVVRLRAALITALALCVGVAACQGFSCNIPSVTPTKPAQVRTPSFFGRITADHLGWTGGRSVSTLGAVEVAGHRFAVDQQTERLGVCPPAASGPCLAWVGLRRPGHAAWVLIPHPAILRPHQGLLEVEPVLVWQVLPSSMVLSNGIELRLSRTLASARRRNGLHDGVQGPQSRDGGALFVNPRTGEVVAAGIGLPGCA